MKSEKKDQLIVANKSYKKSNELINAMGKGTALSQKLFAIGMQHIHIDDTNNVVATIYGTDLRKMFNSNSGSLYEHIEALCDRQVKGRQTIFDWNLLMKDKENGKIEAHQVVTDASFKNGTLELRYNNYLTDKIVNLQKDYTVLSLAETISLKSVYSLRMYEMLNSAYDFQRAVTKRSGEMSFDYMLTELKLELGIINSGGAKEIKTELEKDYPDYDRIEELAEKSGQNKYKEYKIFNRNVLSKVKEELNEKTSLRVDYEPIKGGRKTVGVRFFVEKKDPDSVKQNKDTPVNKDEILDDLMDLMHNDFKFKEVREIAEAADYDVERIKKAYEYMNNYSAQISVPIAFMKDCIKNEYYNSPVNPKKPKNSFNNFEQHNDWKFDELERQLLEN
jgi:plasmid replication initiation protein